jgi:hypothetical protein
VNSSGRRNTSSVEEWSDGEVGLEQENK